MKYYACVCLFVFCLACAEPLHPWHTFYQPHTLEYVRAVYIPEPTVAIASATAHITIAGEAISGPVLWTARASVL